MTNTEIIATMSRCVCGTRIQWTQNPDNSYIQKKPEMTRIADAFSGYIHRHPNLDLVWSEKTGMSS